jgi:hypothetical protein
MVAVGGFLEHAPIEVQPGQYAVDEALRALAQSGIDRRLGHRLLKAQHRRDF